MIRAILSRYNPFVYAKALAYMAQATEYQPGALAEWYSRTGDFSTVMDRKELVPTRAAGVFRLFVGFVQVWVALCGIAGIVLHPGGVFGVVVGALIVVLSPFVTVLLLLLLLVLSRQFVLKPKEKRALHEAGQIFNSHKATIIAVAGSYGKTTMKELLLTVLREGKKVAATPANMNVATSHAKFARGLKGDEDVVIIEFGEGRPGDVARFTQMAGADIAVITGLAPAHLDAYKTVDAAAEDIMSLAAALPPDKVYMNIESPLLVSHLKHGYKQYSVEGCGDVTITNIGLEVTKTEFTLQFTGGQPAAAVTGLLGRHNMGPLAAAADIARLLGLNEQQILAGLAKTMPFEHRMQPRQLPSGAWIIDDTYNGTIEGMKAGLQLLAALPATRTWYVTPGLVEQGKEKIAVHRELGRAIGSANPNFVVLMKNSAANYILDGIREVMFTGDVRIEANPQAFYQGLDHVLAAGDIAMLQNDWSDNYN